MQLICTDDGKILRFTSRKLESIMECLNLREFGYTQQQISDMLGLPRTTILRWLRLKTYLQGNKAGFLWYYSEYSKRRKMNNRNNMSIISRLKRDRKQALRVKL